MYFWMDVVANPHHTTTEAMLLGGFGRVGQQPSERGRLRSTWCQCQQRLWREDSLSIYSTTFSVSDSSLIRCREISSSVSFFVDSRNFFLQHLGCNEVIIDSALSSNHPVSAACGKIHSRVMVSIMQLEMKTNCHYT